MKQHKHVLIALSWYDYRLHRGIEKYAQEHGWFLSASPAREKVIPWGWQGDGILAWLGSADELTEFVECQERPTVDFSFRCPELRLPRVLEDHARAAELVAEHFLSRGFANFMFYSDAPDWSYEERGSGFVAALKREGYPCTWIKWQQSSGSRSNRDQWKRKHAWLAAQLKQAPKPLAVFAANDQLALEVLESSKSAGLARAGPGVHRRRRELSPGAGRDGDAHFERGHEPRDAWLSGRGVARRVHVRQGAPGRPHPHPSRRPDRAQEQRSARRGA